MSKDDLEDNEKNVDKPTIYDLVTIYNYGANTHGSNANNIDTQLNILIGISSALFAFSFTKYESGASGIVYLIMGIFSAATVCIGLAGVHPFRFLRKVKGADRGAFSNKIIVKFDDPDEYAKTLLDSFSNRELIAKEYAREIYRIVKYYYRPKREMYRLARNVFVLGVLFTLLAFCVIAISQSFAQ